jgi:EmrB/QacA subfamily drug resistance transporter
LNATLSVKQYAPILIGLQIAIFLSALDQTILNVAIPKMAAALNGFDKSAWIITAYLLFSTIATPVSGKLADIYGVRSVIIAATFFFGLASLLCGLAGLTGSILTVPGLFVGLDAIDQLIIARALQGTAGGAMIGLCFVAVGDLFAVADRGKYQGFLAAAFIVAALVGPALGGLLSDQNSWRLIFFLNIPFCLLACLLFRSSFPPSSRERARAIIDYQGIAFFVATITPLILGASEIGRAGSLSFAGAGGLLFSAVMFVAFLYREKRAAEPLIPLSLFTIPVVSVSLITVFVTGIGLFGAMLLLAMVLQKMLGMTGTASGLALTPLMVVVALSSIVGGLIVARTKRYKILTLTALLMLGLGTALLAVHTGGSLTVTTVLLDAGIGGIGLGLLLPVHTILIQNVAPPETMGVATSMTQFFRSLGGTIGTGLMSAVMLSLIKRGTLNEAVIQALVLYVAAVVLAFVLNLFLPPVALKSTSKKTIESEKESQE